MPGSELCLKRLARLIILICSLPLLLIRKTLCLPDYRGLEKELRSGENEILLLLDAKKCLLGNEGNLNQLG